jgi:hypothetical protein
MALMRFVPLTLVLAGALALSACDTQAPYSNVMDTTARGVGFSDYAQYMRAQEELSRIRRAQAAQGVPVQSQAIGAQAVAAVRQAPPVAAMPIASAPLVNTAPMTATSPMQVAAAPVPQPASGPATVSNQGFQPQPFGTPAQNTVITRDYVPQVRVSEAELGAGGPNLFTYALSTNHRVGESRYTRRNLLRWQRWEAACTQFRNQDLAQEAFLAAGGPDRDPENLDPDGDGFACWWDPAPFRQAASTVRARQ